MLNADFQRDPSDPKWRGMHRWRNQGAKAMNKTSTYLPFAREMLSNRCLPRSSRLSDGAWPRSNTKCVDDSGDEGECECWWARVSPVAPKERRGGGRGRGGVRMVDGGGKRGSVSGWFGRVSER